MCIDGGAVERMIGKTRVNLPPLLETRVLGEGVCASWM
jgi:hypothetical protein